MWGRVFCLLCLMYVFNFVLLLTLFFLTLQFFKINSIVTFSELFLWKWIFIKFYGSKWISFISLDRVLDMELISFKSSPALFFLLKFQPIFCIVIHSRLLQCLALACHATLACQIPVYSSMSLLNIWDVHDLRTFSPLNLHGTFSIFCRSYLGV